MKFNEETVLELIEKDILYPPMDGNHGNIHPKGNDFVDEGIPFIMASDIENGNINFETCKYITIEQARTLKKGFAKAGDVLLTHKATIGRTAIVPETNYPYIMLSPQVTYYRIKDESVLKPAYLEMYFNSYYFQSILKNWAGSGSTRSYLGILAQRKLPIRIVSIKIQQQIVNSIQPLKFKIEYNKQIISNLEELAQTLFKRWFVDFEFPNEEGKPYKSSGGKMVESDVGMIPEGWEVESLSKIANFQNGLAMQKFRPGEGEDSLPVLKIKELRQGFTDYNSDLCSTNIKDSVKVYDGDVIFSWSATLLVKLWVGGNAGLNQHLFKVTSEEHSKWFYYLWTKHYLDLFNAIAQDKATTMGHIKRSHLDESKVIVPSEQHYIYFDSVFNRIIEQKINLLKENKSLIGLRDTLLPKLLSGEIELPDDVEVTDDVSIS